LLSLGPSRHLEVTGTAELWGCPCCHPAISVKAFNGTRTDTNCHGHHPILINRLTDVKSDVAPLLPLLRKPAPILRPRSESDYYVHDVLLLAFVEVHTLCINAFNSRCYKYFFWYSIRLLAVCVDYSLSLSI